MSTSDTTVARETAANTHTRCSGPRNKRELRTKGRNENGPYHSLTDWVRPPHDMYGKGGFVEENGRYHPADERAAKNATV